MKQSQTKTLLVSSCCHKHLKFFSPPFITFSTRIFTPVGKSLHEQRSHRSHLFAALNCTAVPVSRDHQSSSGPAMVPPLSSCADSKTKWKCYREKAIVYLGSSCPNNNTKVSSYCCWNKWDPDLGLMCSPCQLLEIFTQIF